MSKQKVKKAYPTKVRLTQYYAFYDAKNQFLCWERDQLVEDPREVAMLVSRKAPIVVEAH